jgi:hypothetical protein
MAVDPQGDLARELAGERVVRRAYAWSDAATWGGCGLIDRIEPDEVRTAAESGRSMIRVCDALACQGAFPG